MLLVLSLVMSWKMFVFSFWLFVIRVCCMGVVFCYVGSNEKCRLI